MTSRKRRALQSVVVGAAIIVVGIVLLAEHVSIFGGSALPIVAGGMVPLTLGLYHLFAARQDHRVKK